MVESIAMPAALFPGLSERNGALHHTVELAQGFGLLPGKAEERVRIGTAPPETADALGIEPGAAVLLLDRVVLALDGRPVEWRVGHCHLAGLRYASDMH
jgi:GntR family transcriptional regulator